MPKPDGCVYVGDSITKDLIPAKEVGMYAILVGAWQKESDYIDGYMETVVGLEKVVEREDF